MASTRSPSATPLTPADLRWSCDPASLGFASTDELPPLDLVLGQDRAVQAIRFAMGMRHTGYNLFALGSAGVGKHHVLRRFLEEEASRWPVPDDWCYVHSLADENAPLALRLPPGEGPRLRDELAALVVELKAAIPAAFESEDYLNRRQVIHDQAEKAEDQAFEAVKQLAREHDLVIIRAPGGVVLAPVQNGEVMPNERFETLGPEDQKRIEANLALMHDPVNEAIRRLPALKKRYREAVLQLDQEVSAAAVGPAFAELRARWSPEEVLDWLGALERDVVANAGRFLPEESDEDEEGPVVPDVIQGPDEGSWEDLRRYRVNVLVSHVGSEGAPVVREDDPTLGNLLGRIEHVSTYGALSTDFTRIRPGALHRANGGFLVLDARRLLEEPMAWEHLKQALRHGEIRMPMPSANGGVVTAITLEPQPIPLELKVALVGDRALFYMLGEGDPQLGRLFKVAADFEDDMPRDLESVRGMARLLARLAREDGLRTLSADGVARVVEEAVRLAGDRRRLALEVEALADLLREADHFAGQEGVERTTAAQVDGALAARRFREGRLPDQARRAILDGTVHISTSGTATGEIVGLSVYELGRLSFGAPARISARVRLGEGEVLDIEDEVELSGAIHAKGVHLLEGFIGGRFGAAAPLSVQASLAFEQSYGEIDGDSASLAETCVLLSALAELPLRQDLAVTGSVDQQGRVQAVGGLNEKVEAWFDLCDAQGLSGTQGVIVPAAAIHGMQLRPQVVDAVAAGRFHVYSVRHVDETIALLSGLPAGRLGSTGRWSRGSVNARVAARLARLAVVGQRRGDGP